MPLPERALIADIGRVAGGSIANSKSRRIGHVVRGIGDDCAVLRVPGEFDTLVTTDFTLEEVHFRRNWHPAESVGHRCLNRGLSDIAAMGGDPLAVFLSLALPRNLPQAWVQGFMRGLVRLAEKHSATVAGGDTAQSPGGILADIMVLGAVPKGKAVMRSGARPGDAIYVSGTLGASAAAVRALEAGRKKTVNSRGYPRHFYPEARLELGRALRERGLVSAMIDTSDGLSTDLSHICEESGVGAEIDGALIPRAYVGRPPRMVDLELALHGGEDYELLFTVPPRKRVPPQIAGVRLTYIGKITRNRKLLLRDATGIASVLLPGGWEHFRR
jgi:thiamine-monophosphate kinase